jgi:N-carbamoylputrescine amidase
VCENAAELIGGGESWKALCRQVSEHPPDLVLMNELPFGRWISSGAAFCKAEWDASLELHRAGLKLLGNLGAAVVAITQPRVEGGRRVNEATLWSGWDCAQGIHTKQYFPDEPGYYETRWFEAGDRHFRVGVANGIRVGFLICTELMFNEHARDYGRQCAHVILVPRAVGAETLDRWLVALKMAAIVSGCYVLTSNRAGTDSRGQTFGGSGWIIDPNGDVVAKTSPDTPVVSHEIDLTFVERAQMQYPCYVSASRKIRGATFRNC